MATHWNTKHVVWKWQKKSHTNIVSEASLIYFLSGQKIIKNAKNLKIQLRHFAEFLNNVHKA